MLREDKIIAIYCVVDDLLKGINHIEDNRRKVSDAEAALYFGGHIDNARGFMKMTKLIPNMLDKSRFNRRLHNVNGLMFSLFFQIGHYLKQVAGAAEYVIDSFPVAVCDNIRISRCK